MVGVLHVHFWGAGPVIERLRVSLFFVVSGFLITHILYSAKERGGRIHVLNFYARRMLRLFPALAVLVAIASIFDMDGFRDNAIWHIMQASNIFFATTEAFKPWVAAQLWSLNVLEQFYLLWPIVVLLLPLSRIYAVTLSVLVAMIFIRVNGAELGIDVWWRKLFFVSDPIAFGAFAYLLQRHEPVRLAARSVAAILVSLAVLASPFFMWERFGASEFYDVMIQPALCVIVVSAFDGYGGPAGWLLRSRAARFLSEISYGVYIYHLMLWWLVSRVLPQLFEKSLRTFLVMSAITALFATVSWYLIERPIGRLKHRFPTASPGGRPAKARR